MAFDTEDNLNAAMAQTGLPQLPKPVDTSRKIPPKYPEPRQMTATPAPQDRSKETRPGFFTIYKKGQGYWTRMGTVAGGVLIGLLCTGFLYDQVQVTNRNTAIGVAAGFFAVYSLLVFWLMNKSGNADFLIATDIEMKKVNWTTRSDLIGSTKIVILFMFLIAAILFVIDVIFGYLFYLINVLKTSPFG